METDTSTVSYAIRGKFAIITLNNPKRLNALTNLQYYKLASLMQEIDKLSDVFVTVLTGKGRFFSAGADLTNETKRTEPDVRRHWLQNFVANNLYLTHAFSTHSKIFIAALNGPAVGGSAAIAAFADFIYGTPETFIYTPFASLGLVAEVGTSRTLVQRLGISLANEAMLMGRKIPAKDLLRVGFVNKIIPVAGGEDEKFLDAVMVELEERLGQGLVDSSLLEIKALLQRPERDVVQLQNVAEVFAGWERLCSGVVDEQIRRFGDKRRHRL